MVTPTIGAVQMRITVYGDAEQVFRCHQSALASEALELLRISFRRRGRWRWDDWPIPLSAITPSDRKPADMSLSEVCQRLSPAETSAAMALHDAAYAMMQGRTGTIPTENYPKSMLVTLQLLGPAEALLPRLKAVNDLELLTSVSLSICYLEGSPRKPYERWLPPIDVVLGSAEALADAAPLERRVTADRMALLKATIADVAALFARKVSRRQQELRMLAAEVGMVPWLTERRSPYVQTPMEEVRSVSHSENVAYLKRQRESAQPRGVKLWSRTGEP